ncbi:MAG: 5-(carboxyamino)imidazole ribonucleotide synthase [Blastocatellia bacterium]|nr:5-(carboxyamino)imidazole ribonucleotide synthase [Blastocatellia bacterium]
MVILPGSTIGVFGSGQLGRMFAIEARKMGYRVHTFSPDGDTPTGQVADFETTADYDDLGAVRKFAQSVDVITFEFENVPSAAADAAAEFVDVHPRGKILHITQNRLREKTYLSSNGFPVAPFRHVTTRASLETGVAELGFPCVLKTAGFGYDGKGQTRVGPASDLDAAFESMSGRESVLEAFVDFAKEVSVVCARGVDGSFAHYGVIENEHQNHILDISFSPANMSKKLAAEATDIARSLAETLDYVGTLCVEFFVTRDERLLINELAPRPHNSGHLTFDACVTSQFEQQVRAICGLPLGLTEFHKSVAMANLLGDIWANGDPDWSAALAMPGVKLHLYGKTDPRPGRKMGHLTTTAATPQEAARIAREARSSLSPAR